MESGKSGYKSIIKSTSLFGGVKFFQVIVNLLRGKIIAILLGPAGVGFNGLYQSTISIVSSITGLGLNFSAVREISKANESGDIEKLSRSIKIFRRWQVITVLLGFTAVLVFSGVLSRLTFGNGEYTLMFVLLSLMLIFNALSDSNASILQGARNLKGFALHTLTGSIVSLVVSAPVYYIFGISGIVPALILSAFITWLFSIWYSSRVRRIPVSVTFKEVRSEGGEMIKLGVAMMVTTSLASLANYLVNIFIKGYGSIEDFGLYQAGMSITTQSVGLIFTAMAVDYYPKLSAISDNNSKVRVMVNQQAEVMLLIATPILLMLMIAAPIVIRILLSAEFASVSSFIRIIAVALVFKAASYSIGAISYAKGDKKRFFILEGIFTNTSVLLFSTAGYYLGGLNGLGYGFVLHHIVYLGVVLTVNKIYYRYTADRKVARMLLINICGAFATLVVLALLKGFIAIGISTLIFIAISAHSIIFIDKILDIKGLIYKATNRNNQQA